MSLKATLFFFQLPQDVEILTPIAEQLYKAGVPTQALLTREFAVSYPDLVERIGEFSPIRYASARWIRWGLAPFWSGVSQLITASESSAPPHRVASALTQRANRQGIRTFTVQHGFENIGLTYSDSENPIKKVNFASETIFTWVSPRYLHTEISESVKNRCRSVGFPKMPCPFSIKIVDPAKPYLVGVFENLHWSRYPADYAKKFIAGIRKIATDHPDIQFRIQPHPVGRWTKQDFEFPSNVQLWEDSTEVLLGKADLVLTTPSTIAVQSALRNLPTLVFSDGISDVELYSPLSFIQTESDWGRLLLKARHAPVGFAALSRTFVDQKLNSGNGAQEIAQCLLKDARVAIDRVLSPGVEFST